MIIQSLVRYYNQLRDDPEVDIATPGWCACNVKYLIELLPDGTVNAIVPQGDGKHGVEMIVPEQVKRSSGIAPNFLCDKTSYLLGIGSEETAERDLKCFEASKALHRQLLSNAKGKTASAILGFFDKWNPETVPESIPGLNGGLALKDGNLLFCLADGSLRQKANEDVSIREVWNSSIQTDSSLPSMLSLSTGRRGAIARLHPPIKGVRDAASSGGSLVGFNADSFTSYGHAGEQGLNAPIDVESAQAYTAALNYLLKQSDHRAYLGDTTIAFWSASHTSDYGNCSIFSLVMGMGSFADAESEAIATANLKAVLGKLTKGESASVENASFGDEFYLLGLAPNKARLQVRFFLHDSFGEMMRHLADHYRISDVCHADFEPSFVSPRLLLRSLINPKLKKTAVQKEMAALSQLNAALLRSILQGARYPESLFERVLLRIRTSREVRREHAAIIRAYLIRNARLSEKEITVGMNKENGGEAYVLGRVFAVLEQIQEAANDKATIAESYLNAACATPATTFPILLKLSVAHQKKLARDKPGLCINLKKTLGELLEGCQMVFPKRLSLVEQGSFLLGYYQQRQARYQKKSEQKLNEQ